MPKISYALLTYNRAELVGRCLRHNYFYAGYQIDELIHCDNGSEDNVREVVKELHPRVVTHNSENLGVSKGYNEAYYHCTGDYVLILGCDRLMPSNWLGQWMQYFQTIPNTGIISCYTCDFQRAPERSRGTETVVNGLSIQPAMPFEARILKRDLFLEIGFMDEGFGLYSSEDRVWSERAMMICKEKGLLYYTIPGVYAEHAGEFILSPPEEKEYWAMKEAQKQDPAKEARFQWNRAHGWPRHSYKGA